MAGQPSSAPVKKSTFSSAVAPKNRAPHFVNYSLKHGCLASEPIIQGSWQLDFRLISPSYDDASTACV